MEIQRKFFPKIIKDNEENYFSHLEGVIDSIDEFSSMMITKKKDSYDFRIATSLPKYNNSLISELIKFHNVFNIRLIFSKSMKTSGTIAFKIEI
tara:strand:+ start:1504 stop:1785 length:282 start_codon:yes stop_codon:yes gene_type:complete